MDIFIRAFKFILGVLIYQSQLLLGLCSRSFWIWGLFNIIVIDVNIW